MAMLYIGPPGVGASLVIETVIPDPYQMPQLQACAWVVSLKHEFGDLFVTRGRPNVPVGRGRRSVGVGIGVASTVTVTAGD